MRRSLVALSAVLSLLAVASGAQAREIRIGTVPPLPAGTVPLAGVASEQPLQISVALRPRDPAALAEYAASVSQPSSPDYLKYLNVRAFAARFGAEPQAIQAVRQTLQKEGLPPGQVAANGLSISVRADTGAIERALDIVLERVRLPDGRVVVVSALAPAMPAVAARRVQAVIGLNGLSHLQGGSRTGAARHDADLARLARSVKKRRPHTASDPCSAATTAASQQGAYTAGQIASAYRFASLYTAGDYGQGTSIGVYELEPDDPSDIAAYQSCYGTSTSVSYVQVDGGAGTGAGSGEAALDIEQLITLAPKARLVVYQAPNSNNDDPGSGPYDLLASVVSQDAVQVLTNSWGECEAVEGATDAHAENILLEEAAVEGITVVSAAGDNGSEDCDGLTPTGTYDLAVDDPGSQPYVTDVGGTSLTALGPPPTETVWNSGGGLGGSLGLGGGSGAGGGGISSLWTMPGYQSGAPSSLDVIGPDASATPCGASSGDCREVPDVAADADPAHGYLIYYNGSGSVAGSSAGWQATGGTSGASPLWAALFALADSSSGCRGVPVGFANPALYRLAASGQAAYFNDITQGNNDYTGIAGGRYAARTGYDMASGLGSPNASALVTGLCSTGIRLGVPKLGVTFVGTPVRVTAPEADSTGAQVSYAATGLPPGLAIDKNSGVISGRPRQVGAYTVTITAGDTAGALRQIKFTWMISGRPRVLAAQLSARVLRLTVLRGADEPALKRLRLTLPGGGRLSAILAASGERLRLLLSGARTATLTRVKNLKLSATVSDSGGGSTTVVLRVRVTGRGSKRKV